MGADNNNNNKCKKRKFLPYNKSVKKGIYPLRPGVQGFFITCDGGRERQAANEALNILENFYDELVHGTDSEKKCSIIGKKPLNKIIKFKDSDSSDDENEDIPEVKESKAEENLDDSEEQSKNQHQPDISYNKASLDDGEQTEKCQELPAKKLRSEVDTSKPENTEPVKTDDRPIDELIEDELKELGDRNKRRFATLDSGCNGVIFIQMHKQEADPGPSEILQHMMASAASTKKHMSRFILRVLPAEVTCYASEGEIVKAITPLIDKYFPKGSSNPQKYAVLYEARANTCIERMTIINAVAKSVPEPHKVDLSNPDKTIIIQISKTVCSIGVAERYKELAKFNLRQLTSSER